MEIKVKKNRSASCSTILKWNGEKYVDKEKLQWQKSFCVTAYIFMTLLVIIVLAKLLPIVLWVIGLFILFGITWVTIKVCMYPTDEDLNDR